MKEYLVLFLIVSTALLMEMQYKTIKIGGVIISTRKISFGIIFIYILFLGVFKGESYGYDADLNKLNTFLQIFSIFLKMLV